MLKTAAMTNGKSTGVSKNYDQIAGVVRDTWY